MFRGRLLFSLLVVLLCGEVIAQTQGMKEFPTPYPKSERWVCSNCNGAISSMARPGQSCPYCGVVWGDKKYDLSKYKDPNAPPPKKVSMPELIWLNVKNNVYPLMFCGGFLVFCGAVAGGGYGLFYVLSRLPKSQPANRPQQYDAHSVIETNNRNNNRPY